MRALAILALALLPAEAWGCRLALALAIDTSRSVNSTEYAQQMDGIGAALLDPEVRSALFASRDPVAVAAFEWGGPGAQEMIADWIVLNHGRDVDRLASAFHNHSRALRSGKTAIGSALAYGRDLLRRAPDCARQVIDVSGDGYNNDGPSPREIYGAGDFGPTTVNALVVSGRARPKLLEYYLREVIHGDGAFVETTEGFDDYAEAIKRKLLRELGEAKVVASVGGGG